MHQFVAFGEEGGINTFRKKTTIAIYQMFPQEPAVTKFVITFDEFHAVTLG